MLDKVVHMAHNMIVHGDDQIVAIMYLHSYSQ